MLLQIAREIVGAENPKHGDTETSFEAIAHFWQLYLRKSIAVRHNEDVRIDKEDVAQMMALLKMVRHIFGDPLNDDNFVDQIGYVALAGMFADRR